MAQEDAAVLDDCSSATALGTADDFDTARDHVEARAPLKAQKRFRATFLPCIFTLRWRALHCRVQAKLLENRNQRRMAYLIQAPRRRSSSGLFGKRDTVG